LRDNKNIYFLLSIYVKLIQTRLFIGKNSV